MCKFIISGMKEVDDYLDLRVCCGGVLRGSCFEATWVIEKGCSNPGRSDNLQ